MVEFGNSELLKTAWKTPTCSGSQFVLHCQSAHNQFLLFPLWAFSTFPRDIGWVWFPLKTVFHHAGLHFPRINMKIFPSLRSAVFLRGESSLLVLLSQPLQLFLGFFFFVETPFLQGYLCLHVPLCPLQLLLQTHYRVSLDFREGLLLRQQALQFIDLQLEFVAPQQQVLLWSSGGGSRFGGSLVTSWGACWLHFLDLIITLHNFWFQKWASPQLWMKHF